MNTSQAPRVARDGRRSGHRRDSLAFLLILCGLALGLSGLATRPAAAEAIVQPPGEMVFFGRLVEAQSLKCQVKLPPGVSSRRLVDCDSAMLIDLPRGRHLIRFEIAPGDPSISQGQRAELRDMFEARNGEETWYRFATLLPTDFPFADGERIVTAQWHERMPDGVAHRRPPLAHRIVGPGFQVTLWDDAAFAASAGEGNGVLLLADPALATGIVWEYVYRVVWRQDSGGVVTGWRRPSTCSVATFACRTGPWTRMLDRRGPVGFRDAVGYYFKFGVYTTHRFGRALVVYHGGYRRGPTAASVGATAPLFRARTSALP